MERTCFAFNETKHNHCNCLILNDLECKNDGMDCPFYKHKDKINLKIIEKEIENYAKEKNRMGIR